MTREKQSWLVPAFHAAHPLGRTSHVGTIQRCIYLDFSLDVISKHIGRHLPISFSSVHGET